MTYDTKCSFLGIVIVGVVVKNYDISKKSNVKNFSKIDGLHVSPRDTVYWKYADVNNKIFVHKANYTDIAVWAHCMPQAS